MHSEQLISHFLWIANRSSGVEPALPSASSHVDTIPLDQDSILPRCDPIPPEYVEHSKPWAEV
jgi:hypothetical protein